MNLKEGIRPNIAFVLVTSEILDINADDE